MNTIQFKPLLKSTGAIALAALLIYGCSGKKSTETISSEEFEKANEELAEDVEEVIYDLPEPSEIPALLQETAADFYPNLVNAPQKAGSYDSEMKAAMNLGVYATDIGYLVSYEKMQEAFKYMESAKKLADDIGATATIGKDVIERFESNIDNKDSLKTIINTVVAHADAHLKGNSQNDLAAMMLTGSFIEGMFIATQIVKSYPHDLLTEDQRKLILTPIMVMILHQEKSLDDLIRLLNSVEKEDWIIGLTNSLTELKKAYTKLDIEHLLRKHRADLVLSENRLNQLTVQIEQIRNSISH